MTSLPTAQASEPPSAADARDRPGRGHWLVLLALTLAAGALRLFWLERPCLWWDEASTFGRVTGTLDQLFGVLREDGFVPLHYEAYWLLGRATLLTPFAMRVIPALAGTLMVPAIYFLAVQMLPRRTALAAAAFAACSAYLSFYSRDAKMYMHLWLFVTLHVGCLLWWLRARRRVAWLCWVATGVAAAGLHAPALIIVGLEPVFFLFVRDGFGNPLPCIQGRGCRHGTRSTGGRPCCCSPASPSLSPGPRATT